MFSVTEGLTYFARVVAAKPKAPREILESFFSNALELGNIEGVGGKREGRGQGHVPIYRLLPRSVHLHSPIVLNSLFLLYVRLAVNARHDLPARCVTLSRRNISESIGEKRDREKARGSKTIRLRTIAIVPAT